MKTTRRKVIAGGLAATVIPGCSGKEPRIPSTQCNLPPVSIDIHNHIFNAQDIPIDGFVEQVLIRDPHTAVSGSKSMIRSLVRLVTDIILFTHRTPTAAAELKELNATKTLLTLDRGQLLRQDRSAVAHGLRILERKAHRSEKLRGLKKTQNLTADNLTADEVLLSRLTAAAGMDPSPPLATQKLGPEGQVQISTANRIARSIYADDIADNGPTQTLQPSSIATRKKSSDQSLTQTLKWAGLLTRSRTGILSELRRLYGYQVPTAASGRNEVACGIKVFSPSIVDFTYWLGAADDRDRDRDGSDILDQLALLSRMALLEQQVLLLPFAPFCPLRAAVYRKQNNTDWLKIIKHAVNDQGFAGIKLYPPMGFLPYGNEDFDNGARRRPHALTQFGITGKELDFEMGELFDWCVEDNVPIKAHGNNSLGADACTGTNVRNPEHSAGQSDDIRPPDPEYPATLGMPS